jgi:hypothetical protein
MLNINDYSLLLGVHYLADDEDPDEILKQNVDIRTLINGASLNIQD